MRPSMGGCVLQPPPNNRAQVFMVFTALSATL